MYLLRSNLIILIGSVLLNNNFIPNATGEKILFLLPLATKSHKNVFEPLFTAMADRGHDVTVISPGYLPQSKKNIREIVPITYDDIVETQGQGGYMHPLERRSQGKTGSLISVNFQYVLLACHRVYQSQDFQDFLHETESSESHHQFDLIFVNGFLNNCFQGVIFKLKAPFIIVTSLAAPRIITYAVGNHLPPSFVPIPMSDFTDDMNFMQRTKNFLIDSYFKITFTRLYTQFEEVYQSYLGAGDLPDLETLEKNVSMIFSNSYFPLTFPRPLLPDIVEVGGMHCRPAKSLPPDLDQFLSDAEHGFIYFSLGSVMNTDQISNEMRLKFLNVFSRMKQRVIWKWNSGHMDDLPGNVRVSKWLPQQDILGHQNIRVFMTHGGLLSTQEAAYHGVPLIGIPIFADQDLNMKQAVSKGYALTMEILTFTEETLTGLLENILNEPGYTAEAKKLSSIIKDQLQTPLERAIFWSEYVIRHKGAHHLRSAARQLNYFQYHSIDVIMFIGFILIVFICILIISCKLCVRRIYHFSEARKMRQNTDTNFKKGQ